MSDFDPQFAAAPNFTGPLPEAVDAVVIGGGIAGVMAAWHLTEEGLRVLLCEKGQIAGEQSSRNWGWIRRLGRDLDELPIMDEALAIWQQLAQKLGPELGFQRSGILYVAGSEKELAEQENWRQRAGQGFEMVSAAGIAELMPGAAQTFVGGIQAADDARAEPWQAVPLIARALAEKGAILREGLAVRALDVQAGQVAGVQTEAGRVRSERVLLAGGAWSSIFLRNHGLSLPQLSVRSTVAATTPMAAEFPIGAVAEDSIAYRKRADGGFTLAPSFFNEFALGPDAFRHLWHYLPTIRHDAGKTRYQLAAPQGFPDGWGTKRRWAADEVSPFEQMRVLNPSPNLARVELMRKRFETLFPSQGAVTVAQSWAGMIDVLPDVLPVLGDVPELPGLYVATGLSGHGFGIGPGVGRVMADLMRGRAAGHDLSRFRFDRFKGPRPQRSSAL